MFTLSKENRINSIIPDQSSLSDTIYINRPGKIQDIKVSVAISHPFMGDISVKLLSPSGKEILLRNREGGSINNMNTVFQGGELATLSGEPAKGAWILTVQDHAAQDDGTLDLWGLDLTCEEYEVYKTEIFIPEMDKQTTLTSIQECRFSGRVTKAEAEVEIDHPLIGDLVISVVAPSGKEVIIQDRVGGSQTYLKKQWSNASLKDFVGESTNGAWTLKVKSFHHSNTGTLKHWKIRFHYEREDDLKIIEGIGPKIEAILKEASLYSFVDLAATTPSAIKSILVAESDAYQLHEPESWPRQAMLAAQGKWVELEAFKGSFYADRISY